MSMYNLLEYSDTYSKTSVNLWQYYRVELALINDNFITDFPEDNNNSNSFKFKQKITGQTTNNGTKDVEIIVPLKHLSKFWRTLEMPLLNCEISLMCTWSKNYFSVAGNVENKNPTFIITDTKLYVPVVILSFQDCVKLMKQLQPGFERSINCNKYRSKQTLDRN